MLVFCMLCRITVFRRTQNWVSVSDGSRADNASEFQSVEQQTANLTQNSYNLVTKGLVFEGHGFKNKGHRRQFPKYVITSSSAIFLQNEVKGEGHDQTRYSQKSGGIHNVSPLSKLSLLGYFYLSYFCKLIKEWRLPCESLDESEE